MNPPVLADNSMHQAMSPTYARRCKTGLGNKAVTQHAASTSRPHVCARSNSSAMNRSPSSGYSPHENAICSLKKRSWPLLLHRPGFSAKQCASCSAFTPGNVVIHRIGDGVAGQNAKSVVVFLDEYPSVGRTGAVQLASYNSERSEQASRHKCYLDLGRFAHPRLRTRISYARVF